MSKSTQFQSSRDFTRSVKMLVGQTTSTAYNDSIVVGSFDTMGCNIVGIRTDANLTATSLRFQVGNSLDGTFLDYYTNDSSTPALLKEIKLTVSTSKHFAFDRDNFSSVQFIKIIGNIAQLTIDSVITLVLRP